jgi:hypothetical protein
MKSVTRWSPKLRPGKQPGKDDIVECKEELPPDRIGAALAIGSLATICVTIAILLLWDIRRDKDAGRSQDSATLDAQETQQKAGDVESKPTRLDPPVRSTSSYPSSLPTPGLVIKGFQEALISHQ